MVLVQGELPEETGGGQRGCKVACLTGFGLVSDGKRKGRKGSYWIETSRLLLSLSSLTGEWCWRKRTCVAWLLVGEAGFTKRRLPSGRWDWVWPGAGKKSTRAPMRGVEEGVSWPHIVGEL